MKGDRAKWVPENLGISKQPVPGPWGLLPISASSQGTRVRSSLSLNPSGVSVTWDDCSEEAWLFYHSKTTGGPHCRLIGVDSCHLTKENPAPSSLSSPSPQVGNPPRYSEAAYQQSPPLQAATASRQDHRYPCCPSPMLSVAQ